MKFSKARLKELENTFIAQGYNVRYEKGNFHSGYCLVKDKKVIIINKFFKPPSRFECLLNILDLLQDSNEFDENEVFDIIDIEEVNGVENQEVSIASI